MNSKLRIGIVAGEVSGDLLGARLIQAWQSIYPDIEFIGITGPLMRDAGCASIATIDSLSVMGAVEVLAKLPQILSTRRKVLRTFLKNPPAIFIGIDAPDFNLPIASILRRAGIFTVQYNSPTVWAWRQGRIKNIARAINLMLTLLPFEAKFYQQQQIPVAFVGHPLADEIPESVDQLVARTQLGIPLDAVVVALLPGSRRSELKQLGHIFLQTARWCLEKKPHLHFIVPAVNAARRQQFEHIWHTFDPKLTLTIFNGQSQQVIAAADAVLVASGTATLETCLLKRPMVVAYRFSALTAWLARRLVKLRIFSLPNLIAEKPFIPEFFQQAVTPANLGQALLTWLDHPEQVAAFRDQCVKIHQQLRLNGSISAVKAIISHYEKFKVGKSINQFNK